MATVGQADFLQLRGYEAKDYLQPDSDKKTEKTDYSDWATPSFRGSLIPNHQAPGNNCAFFEDQMLKCMQAFGAKLGRLYCDLEHRDIQECVSNDKKVKRFNMIRDVRFKKWLRGETRHIYEPIDDYLRSVHGAPTAYGTNQKSYR